MTRVSDPKKAPDIPPEIREFQERLSKELNSMGPEYAASFFSQSKAKASLTNVDSSTSQETSATRKNAEHCSSVNQWPAAESRTSQVTQAGPSTPKYPSPDTYFIPPGVATAQSPLTQPKFEQMVSLDQFSQPVEGGLEHICTCQESCQCLGCPVHPFNRRMNAEVQQLAGQWRNTMPTSQAQRINMSNFSIFDYTAPLSHSEGIPAERYDLPINTHESFGVHQNNFETRCCIDAPSYESCCMPLEPQTQDHADPHVLPPDNNNEMSFYSTAQHPTIASPMHTSDTLQSPPAFLSDSRGEAYPNYGESPFHPQSPTVLEHPTSPSSCCSPPASQFFGNTPNMQSYQASIFADYGDPP